MIEGKEIIDSKNFAYGTISIKIVTKSGIVRKTIEQRMDSFVAPGIFDSLNAWWTGNLSFHTFNFPSDDGLSIRSYIERYVLSNSGANYSGIWVGSGTTAVGVNDEAPDNLILHGAGAGQLEYGSVSVNLGPSRREFDISRSFENSSGSPIDVNEVGMSYLPNKNFPDAAAILSRDVLDTTITLADQEALIVDYQVAFNTGSYNIPVFSYHYLDGDADTVFKDPNGNNISDRGCGIVNDDWPIGNASGSSSYGLWLGTGDTAPSLSDYSLDSRIPHGQGAGELTRQNHIYTYNKDNTTGTIDMILEAGFKNDSGADITVRELGWFSRGFAGTGMIFRTVLNNPATIVAGTVKTARYTVHYEL